MALQDTLKTITAWNVPPVSATTSLKTAIDLMSEHGVCALAVATDGEILGLVTDLDLSSAVVRGWDPRTTMVAECMTACDLITGSGARNPCVQLDEDETVENALKLLDGQGVHNLLVSGPGSSLVGIVSSCSLLKAAIA